MMMFNDRPQKIAHVALIVLICGTLTPLILAQDDDSLRRENEQLKQQVDQARSRIAELERQIQRLNAALQQRGSGTTDLPPVLQPEVTIDESKPDASPRALRSVLEKEYEEITADLEIGEYGDRQRKSYLRTVERWINAANRKYRSRIEWHVKIFEPPHDTMNPSHLKLLAVDPVTHAELGQSFTIAVTRQLARQLDKIENRGQLNVFVMKGVLTPELRLDPNTMKPGPFNHPQLVGPFVTFDFIVMPQSFLTAEDNEREKTD